MNIKRLLTAAAFAVTVVALGCALYSCKSPTDRDTLRWRSAIDVPINQSFPVRVPDDINVLLGLTDTVPLDLGTDNVPVGSDIIDFLKKFTDHETDYTLSVTNNTAADLTLYALLFREGDAAAVMDTADFSNLLKNSPDALAAQDRISLLGPDGLFVSAHGGIGSDTMPSGLSEPLCRLILTPGSLTWRWLARVSAGDSGNLEGTEAAADSVIARLRLRVSGVNSFDSLLTM